MPSIEDIPIAPLSTASLTEDIRQPVWKHGCRVATLLRPFCRSISYYPRSGFLQPRAGTALHRASLLEEATCTRLMAALDCSIDNASRGLGSLLECVRKESIARVPSVIGVDQLLGWIGLRQKTELEKKPIAPDIYVYPRDQIDEVQSLLRVQRIVVLQGLPRIGKSQLVSALIDSHVQFSKYFWFTCSGEGSDMKAFWTQLAYSWGELWDMAVVG